MRVAITGGTGCLGRPLLERLLDASCDVRLLGYPGDRGIDAYRGRIEIVPGDLNDVEALKHLTDGRDVVYHLAGKVHTVPKSPAERDEFQQVNVLGTRNLLDAAGRGGVKRVVFYSTVGVYGPDADFHGDENTRCAPESVYASTKRVGEQLVLEAHGQGGPEGVVLRFPVVYGPLDRGNMARLIRAVARGVFFYFGDGTSPRSMISSVNAAHAAFLAGTTPGAGNRLYCVTDGEDVTLARVVESIRSALGHARRPVHVPLGLGEFIGRIGDVLDRIGLPAPVTSARVRKLSRPLTFSCERVRRELGYRGVQSLEGGIRSEVEWLRSIRAL